MSVNPKVTRRVAERGVRVVRGRAARGGTHRGALLHGRHVDRPSCHPHCPIDRADERRAIHRGRNVEKVGVNRWQRHGADHLQAPAITVSTLSNQPERNNLSDNLSSNKCSKVPIQPVTKIASTPSVMNTAPSRVQGTASAAHPHDPPARFSTVRRNKERTRPVGDPFCGAETLSCDPSRRVLIVIPDTAAIKSIPVVPGARTVQSEIPVADRESVVERSERPNNWAAPVWPIPCDATRRVKGCWNENLRILVRQNMSTLVGETTVASDQYKGQGCDCTVPGPALNAMVIKGSRDDRGHKGSSRDGSGPRPRNTSTIGPTVIAQGVN